MAIKNNAGYQANRARISVALSRFTVPLLSRIYQAFDGDVVAAIVLGEIAHRNMEAWSTNMARTEEALNDPKKWEAMMRPCNALSIAEACSIPRETVRRKVVVLIERGYIYRNEMGYLYLSNAIGERVNDVTEELVTQLLATARRLEILLANQRASVGPLGQD